MASLLQHSTLIDILKHGLLPSYACLTDDWWSCWIFGYGQWTLKNYISTGQTHIYPLVILIKYSASDYYSWSQILSLLFRKADVIAQLLMSDIIVELLKSYIVLEFLNLETIIKLFPKSASVVQFLKLKIVIKFLKSDNVADIRYLDRYEALFIEASFAIAYCIEQYFSLYFSRCADATPIDTF